MEKGYNDFTHGNKKSAEKVFKTKENEDLTPAQRLGLSTNKYTMNITNSWTDGKYYYIIW